MLNFKFHQRAVHKLRNADGVGGWSAKGLLMQGLLSNFINKMTTKTLLRGGGTNQKLGAQTTLKPKNWVRKTSISIT